jgi:metallophosphoesterase (TIGR00282 family)
MSPIDDPFREADRAVSLLKAKTPVIVVDFHAEATSEKVAMGWFLDGRVSAVVGTHTHVQTADERVLPKGTGYITDLGMTGPYDSVIGRDKDKVIQKFWTQVPVKYDVAEGDPRLMGVLLEVNPSTGKCLSISRVRLPEGSAPLPRE